MQAVYRVVAFGQARGPWRSMKRQAVRDAIIAGLAERDEWGQVYYECFAGLQWMRDGEIMPDV